MNALALTLLLACPPSDAPAEPFMPWPAAIQSQVHQSVGSSGALGYSRQQMSSFPGYDYRLGYVSQLFADAEMLPQETNQLATRLMEGGFEESVAGCMRLIGSKIVTVSPASMASVTLEPLDANSQQHWDSLPIEVHQAVERLAAGLIEARPLLHEAFDWDALGRAIGDTQVRDLGNARVFQHAAAPWLGSVSSGSLSALRSFRSTPLGNGSMHVLHAVREAIPLLLQADTQNLPAGFDICRLKTEAGTVAILGKGDNTYQGNDAIVVDLGGNDRYSGRIAVPLSKESPVGILIDLGGNDIYDGRRAPASLACGLFGIGALFDLGGHDKYYCDSSGLGCAWHGIGLLLDTVGNDVYTGRQWTQGAAHAGVGMLIDESGDDQYFCQLESQGLGSTLGIGVLIDKLGKDRYHAYDNENGRRITFPSSQTKSHETSLSQGCGYGRRADNTDGHSMAGGVGALIDGAGDDSYYGGVFSQATGFWWSLGMLVDFGGNDTYRGVYYAQGAAAHFAIGSLVDHAGNDRYNDRGVLGQVLGAGRDGAIGTLVDAGGNDIYYIPKKSAGGGDMNAIGLMSDKAGSDQYLATSSTYLGTASTSNPRGDYFRRSLPTLGIFVDLEGDDRYGSVSRPRNNASWYHQSGPPAWGFGLDLNSAHTATAQ